MDSAGVSSGAIATSLDPITCFGSLIDSIFDASRLVGLDAASASGWSGACEITGTASLSAFISLEASELVGTGGSVVPKKLAEAVESGVSEVLCFSVFSVSTRSATEGLGSS